MASVLDLYRTPAATDEPPDLLKRPPDDAPPKPKTSVLDVVNTHQAAPPPAPKPTGTTAGASLGEIFRRDKERAETPELLRRPEEPEPEPPPRPDEAPPLLKRPYEEPPPGAYGVPTTFERYAIPAARIGAPIVGYTAGSLAGPGAPVMSPLAGATAATATELALQKYETKRGLRKEVSPGGVAFQGALGAIQGLPLPATLSAPARIAARTAEGTAFGTGATTAGTLIEEKRLPTKEELAWGAGTGALFGAGGGTFEAKGVPYLHERSPEFIGPRPEGELSWRQRRTAQKFATSADQLAGETTLPPVGERQQMVRQDDGTYLQMPDTPEDFRARMQAGRPPLRSEAAPEAAPVVEPPRMVTQPGETIGGGPGEFVGPPAPERAAAAAEAPPPGSLAAVQAAQAAAAEPQGRVTPILRYDDVMGMSADDLEAAHAQQRDYERSAAVDVFGPEEAKRYEQLQRTANSTIAPHETTRAASDQIAQMESGLTPAQEARLFGFAEEGYNADDMRRIARAARDYDPANVADLPDDDLLNTAGRELLSGNLKDDPVSAIRLHGALRELGNRGYDKSVIQDAVVRRAAREGISPGEAQELMDANLRDLQAKRAAPTPTPEPVQLAQGRALPAPEPGEVVGPPEPPEFVGPPAPPAGGEAPPPGRPPGEAPPLPGAEEAPAEEVGPWGRPPTFRRYRGLGEALTGEEIPDARTPPAERVQGQVEAVDREFGTTIDDAGRDRLKQIITENADHIAEQSRQTQPMERTRGRGRDLVMDLDAAKLEPKGTTWNDTQIAAAKNNVVALDRALKDAQAAWDAEPTAANGLRLQKAAQDLTDMVGIYQARRTESGRALNYYKATADEVRSGNERLLMAGLKKGVPPEKIAEIIRDTREQDVATRADMLRLFADRGGPLKRVLQAGQTIFVSNLLSGFYPHEKNFAANLLRAATSPFARPFSAAIERYYYRVPEGRRLAYAGEFPKRFAAMVDALPRAALKAFEILKSGYTLEQAAKYDVPMSELFYKQGPKVRAAANIVPRALSSADQFARILNEEQSLAGQAYVRARNEAYINSTAARMPEGMDFVDHMAGLFTHYRTNPTPEMMMQAEKEGTRGVFQERTRAVKLAQDARDLLGPPGPFLIPFLTTQTNIAEQGVHLSPLGWLHPKTRAAYSAESLHLKGEAALGTTAVALLPLALYAIGGKIRGSGPVDRKANAEWQKAGNVPNSIEIGGHQMEYGWMGPAAVPLAQIGNAWDKYEEIKREKGHVDPIDAFQLGQSALLGSARVMLDQPMLQTLDNLYQYIMSKGDGFFLRKTVADVGQGFVPASGFQKWIHQINDPTIRDPKTITERFEAAYPWGLAENVPPRLGAFGEPTTMEKPGGAWGRALIPFRLESPTPDPVREELQRHGVSLSPPSSITVKPEEGPPLTPREDLEIKKGKGQQLRQELEELFASDAYHEADRETQKKMLKGIVGRTRAVIGARAKAMRDEGIVAETLRY